MSHGRFWTSFSHGGLPHLGPKTAVFDGLNEQKSMGVLHTNARVDPRKKKIRFYSPETPRKKPISLEKQRTTGPEYNEKANCGSLYKFVLEETWCFFWGNVILFRGSSPNAQIKTDLSSLHSRHLSFFFGRFNVRTSKLTRKTCIGQESRDMVSITPSLLLPIKWAATVSTSVLSPNKTLASQSMYASGNFHGKNTPPEPCFRSWLRHSPDLPKNTQETTSIDFTFWAKELRGVNPKCTPKSDDQKIKAQ